MTKIKEYVERLLQDSEKQYKSWHIASDDGRQTSYEEGRSERDDESVLETSRVQLDGEEVSSQ